MTKATQSQLAQFIRLLTHHCPERGPQQAHLDADFLAKLLAADPKKIDRDAFLASLIGERLAHPEVTITLYRDVPFDPTLPFKDMIKATKCDWVHSDVSQEHFPILPAIQKAKKDGELGPYMSAPSEKELIELLTVHFNRRMKTPPILAYLDEQELRSATLQEACAFAVAHPPSFSGIFPS